jgi:hypothetical protein
MLSYSLFRTVINISIIESNLKVTKVLNTVKPVLRSHIWDKEKVAL